MKFLTASLLFVFTLFFIFYQSSQTQAGNQFIPGFDDLPIMEGMKMSREKSFAFDSASGRVVTAELVTKKSRREIVVFYEEVLQNLGWYRDKQYNYRRDNNIIEIHIFKQQGGNLVRFKMQPASSFNDSKK